ncbi:hypothetical protein RND81_09G262200 [Saponaria officinalis]|uniref:Uncharacterized protein n=1 Tax=Saponaria officinalis TaxID=3572 RepID=A0AAW1IR48_SAPOF
MLGEMSMLQIITHLGVFLIIQALVYIILTNSSNVFSKDKQLKSLTFKRARSLSIRRILSLVSDQPSEPSPTALPSPVFRNDPY